MSANSDETNREALKRKYHNAVEGQEASRKFSQILRTVSEIEAIDLLHRLRGGTDIIHLVRQAEEGDLLMQLALAPETRLRYQFPCQSSMPTRLLESKNPYLRSVLYEACFSQEPTTSSTVDDLSRYQSIYLIPYHSGEVIDPLIQGASLSRWTSVSSDDSMLRALLHTYFLHDYTIYPAFQKDIFLQALKTGDKRFCSTLLVNALLAEACVRNLIC